MSERTFLYIHKIIRFDDVLTRRGQRNDDKFAPIRNLWEKWSEQLPIFYNPNDCVTVDEQLLGFHGRCKFRQYIPSKPERYGLKFWLLVDSRTCYVWKIQPYLGKGVTGNTERNQGERVVLDLVDGLKGHNVTMDNFFSSHSLGQKLLQKQMTMVGTMRKNKRSIPPKLLNCKKVPRYESTFAFTPDTTLVSYISHKNKCTVVMSTLHHAPNIENESKKLPEIISFYNSTKGGVDTVDKMLSCYSYKRKTNRWTMAVFSNIIDISALNSYILYNDIDPNWKKTQKHTKRKCFLHELAISLAKPYMEKRKKGAKNELSSALLYKLSFQNISDTSNNDTGPSKKQKNDKSPKKNRARCQKCYHSGEHKNKWTSSFCFLCKTPCCTERHAKNICIDCIHNT
ncbi:piggyBac transposable element-derived protein 4-like [Bactrocera neohumeralis]|uniref:piggyBac transposable element-derived protein 4-like n=1 Tax=Bactrocera neohumeralis TaxID=98809 RepID=UPI0021655D58|nr:piggyBac transposable element-derived protein 4-like [Bactrocera neohumeralis]